MKTVFCIVLFTSLLLACNPEPKNTYKDTEHNSGKIKVYLLGTFHFAQLDSSYNVLDTKHQKSIEELSDIIAKQVPDKIFVERQPEYEFQNKLDSLYKVYLKMPEKITAKNEIYQLGFRSAKKLGHRKIYQCDHPGRFGSISQYVTEYARQNNQDDILSGKKLGTIQWYDDRVNEDSIMYNSSLLEYIQWLNSESIMTNSHASYLTNYPQIGSNDYYNYDDDNTLIGAELTADWYRRNIMIYTKMINQLDYNEDAIFLLMGADHIPIIKSFFDPNPHFHVVPTEQWLTE